MRIREQNCGTSAWVDPDKPKAGELFSAGRRCWRELSRSADCKGISLIKREDGRVKTVVDVAGASVPPPSARASCHRANMFVLKRPVTIMGTSSRSLERRVIGSRSRLFRGWWRGCFRIESCPSAASFGRGTQLRLPAFPPPRANSKINSRDKQPPR